VRGGWEGMGWDGMMCHIDNIDIDEDADIVQCVSECVDIENVIEYSMLMEHSTAQHSAD